MVTLTSKEEDYVVDAREVGYDSNLLKKRNLNSGILNLLNLRDYNEGGHVAVLELCSGLRLLNIVNNGNGI